MTSGDLNFHLSEKMTEVTSNGLTENFRTPCRSGVLGRFVLELAGGGGAYRDSRVKSRKVNGKRTESTDVKPTGKKSARK